MVEAATSVGGGTALAFAVVDAPGADAAVDGSFFGEAIRFVEADDIALAYVPGREQPAQTQEVLLVFHAVVEHLAARGACLPHRFGTIVDLGRAHQDLVENHELFGRALDGVRNRVEMLVRGRVVPTDAVAVLGDSLADVRRAGDAIEIGRRVHELVTPQLAGDLGEAVRSVERSGHHALAELHSDGLGFDLVIVQPSDVDPDGRVGGLEELSRYCELERFDPTPCYRHAARLLVELPS